MEKPSHWIVRTTLDAYDACRSIGRVGANQKTLKRLEKVSDGDFGVFYISTTELHKSSQTVSAFRTLFIFSGNVEQIPIEVKTLPLDKSLEFSIPIKIIDDANSCKIQSILEKLAFVKKKDHWGSYLMQPFINILASDYAQIAKSLGVDSCHEIPILSSVSNR